ncbi:unnamed protein product [Chrysodeixis includens]|uniref:Uncharacterized protein n=1 Tax=Chrysodeixis includens TaxID=689277 RepID=A0A9N8Q031_CHRIL|nr:unnamed protein product [Chrysodeixis includens]
MEIEVKYEIDLHVIFITFAGVSLSDSPTGFLAYLLKKFYVWIKTEFKNLPDGDLWLKFTKDQLLDKLTIYWSTINYILKSMRLYAEILNYIAREMELDQ